MARVQHASDVTLREKRRPRTTQRHAVVSCVCMPQAEKRVTSLLVEMAALKQQLAARDASLAQAAQHLQTAVAKADAAETSHGLKVTTTLQVLVLGSHYHSMHATQHVCKRREIQCYAPDAVS